VTAGQGAEYAIERFRQHADRFDQLASIAERGVADEGARRLAADLWERDKVFADVNYRDWSPRSGVSATGPDRPLVGSAETSGSDFSSGAPSAEPQWTASGS
jgi:hypothetical protein